MSRAPLIFGGNWARLSIAPVRAGITCTGSFPWWASPGNRVLQIYVFLFYLITLKFEKLLSFSKKIVET
jgi:hypothetical protein